MRQFNDRLHVDHFERRVRNRFKEDNFGVGTDRSLPRIQITTIDQRQFDAKPLQHVLEDIEARSEQRAARHNMIASLQHRHQRTVHRGHTRSGGKSCLNALKVGHTIFEHSNGRVAIARIDKFVFTEFHKTGLCLFCGFVDKALRQKNRLGQFVILAAAGARMHGASAFGKFVHVFVPYGH